MGTGINGTFMITSRLVTVLLYCVLQLCGTTAATKIHGPLPIDHQAPVVVDPSPPSPPPAGKVCDAYCLTINMTEMDRIIIQGALNLEYLEADYFLWAAFGYGLDRLDPGQSQGGPAPLGVQKANLEPYYEDIIMQLGLQEIGHLRIIKATIGAEFSIPRPLMNLTSAVFAEAMNRAVGLTLDPPFDPYASSLNFLLSVFTIPYTGLTTFVGASADIVGTAGKLLSAKVMSVEAGQDAIIRNELYRRKDERVEPYNMTTAEFTVRIADLHNTLQNEFADEGLVVPKTLGVEGKITGNILSTDADGAAYHRKLSSR